ncbi:hypothetical protein D5086_025027 [Populus alba]|uniref:Uncharacterized protein n=1 Tax=Populus alba TaxID=43335 RepID=A0ACC4B7N2_POPAL
MLVLVSGISHQQRTPGRVMDSNDGTSLLIVPNGYIPLLERADEIAQERYFCRVPMRMSHNSGSCVINDLMFITRKLNRGHSCSLFGVATGVPSGLGLQLLSSNEK